MSQIEINEVEAFIEDLFSREISETLTYHDIVHTRYVVDQTRKIGTESGLNDEELSVVIAAAWFHDSGFTVSNTSHEEEGIKIAKEYLSGKNVNDETINRIEIPGKRN